MSEAPNSHIIVVLKSSQSLGSVFCMTDGKPEVNLDAGISWGNLSPWVK